MKTKKSPVQNVITSEKINKYFSITNKALIIVKKSVIKGREKDADEIIKMVSNYLSDSKYFMEKGDFVNSFAAINYAHGWIDAGVRTNIFNVKDDKLFTIR